MRGQDGGGYSIRKVLRDLRPLRSATIEVNGAIRAYPPAINDHQRALLDVLREQGRLACRTGERDLSTLVWFWPERDRYQSPPTWSLYRQAASELGIRFEVASVDDVHVFGSGDDAIALLRGEALPKTTVAVNNKVFTWPAFAQDIWRSVALFRRLRACGYFMIHDDDLTVLTNDKMATIAELGGIAGPCLPTLAVETRLFRDLPKGLLERAGIQFPVIVKPAHWAGGMGSIRAGSEAELTMALRLASAAELSMVIQPLLPHDLVDTRVYCIEGVPTMAAFRTPGARNMVANLSGGGVGWVGPVPEEVYGRAADVAAHLGVEWLAVDFLSASGVHYLSEVEIDPYVSDDYFADDHAATMDRYHQLIQDRFRLVLERMKALETA